MKRIITKDKSITFYSEEYTETYHSISGAAEEAIKKFAEPALGRIKKTEGSIKILDICFGIGYNSTAAIDFILKQNPKCKIEIIGLEKDIEILREIENLNPPFKNYILIKKLIKNKFKLNKIKNFEFKNENIKMKNKLNENLIKNNTIKFENKNIETLNFKFKKLNEIELNEKNIKLKILIGDAKNTIKTIKNTKFDAVFLDPFSPPKNPELWTADFFKDIKKLMKKDSILATYSCARLVRENLESAGFEVRDGPVVGRRGPGTVAITE